MIGTVLRQSVSNGDVVQFVEGDLGSASWTPVGLFQYDGGATSFLSLDNITSKTVSGFTLTGLLGTVEIYGAVSDGGEVDEADVNLGANAIVSLNNVKAYLQLTSADSTDDAFFRYWINTISGVLEDWVGGQIVSQNQTDVIMDGSGSHELVVPFGPIAQIGNGSSPAVTDIKVRTDPASSTWDNLLSNINYAMISHLAPSGVNRSWIRLYNGIFPYGFKNIKLNYKAGYLVTPAPFVQVCIEKVVEVWTQSKRGGSRLGVQSMTGSVESMSGNISFMDLSEKHKTMLRTFNLRTATKTVGLYR